jgi:CxxC motif-containing protein
MSDVRNEDGVDARAVGDVGDVAVSHYLCIGCPLGCRLEVEDHGNGQVEVRGQSCKKGEAFGRQEHLDPRRTVTTTVAIRGSFYPRLPVKTKGDVPKDAVVDVCRLLHALRVEAPVTMGQTIAADVLGTGVDVVASRDLPRV